MGDIKFRKNDIVVLESYDKNHKWICELKSVTDHTVYYIIGTYDVNSGNDNIMVDSHYKRYSDDTLRKATKEEKDLFNNLVNKVFEDIDNKEGVDETSCNVPSKKLLAIKGDENRGMILADIFISLGGNDMTTRPFCDDTQYFYIDEEGDILNHNVNTVTPEHFDKYTIDGFLFNFPYRINDFVKLQENGNDVQVTNMYWDGTQVIYEVQEDNGKFHYNLTTLDLSPMVDNSSNVEDGNEMEVDDEQFYFVRRPDNMVEYSGNLPSDCNLEVIKQKHKIFKTKEEAEEYQKIVGIPSNREKLNKLFKEAELDITYGYSTENKVESTGYMQIGKTIAVIFNDANYEDEVELQLGDYEIEVRDGKTFAVKKKPVYPKTIEECIALMRLQDLLVEGRCGYEWRLVSNLQKLLLCRDAYWKIAGEQMGLGDSWKYDMSKDEFSCAISYQYGCLEKNEIRHKNAILAFPTKEMRDAFYENFKDLIEQCKELL